MLYNYFRLQFILIIRKLNHFGLSTQIGIPVLIIAFFYLSNTIVDQIDFGNYLYSLFAISIGLQLSDNERNTFLYQTFTLKQYYQVRILENSLISLPFCCFLLFKANYLLSLITLVTIIITSFIKVNKTTNFVVPTPFSKKPFEFSVGFRKSYPMLFILYLLTIISIKVNNPNLAIGSILGIMAIICGYYLKPEKDFFVWIYNSSPKLFLIKKLKSGIQNTILVTSPQMLLSGLYFTDSLDQIALFYLIGLAAISIIIVMKYAAFPNEIGIPQGIFLAVGCYFPPLLFLQFPYFYHQAIKDLKKYLV